MVEGSPIDLDNTKGRTIRNGVKDAVVDFKSDRRADIRTGEFGQL
jgi:hypothetical protein